MDPMARVYGKLDTSERVALWTSGRPIMEILEEEERISRKTRPANDNGPDWSVIRDHSPDDLDDWLDGVDVPVRTFGPCIPKIVKGTPDEWMPKTSP